jgi:hypothetical protein
MTGLGDPIMGDGTKIALGDPRLNGLSITKYQLKAEIRNSDGSIKEQAVIHYLKDNNTGQLFDFKFKADGTYRN